MKIYVARFETDAQNPFNYSRQPIAVGAGMAHGSVDLQGNQFLLFTFVT
jgi:hypothetical protein